MKERLLEMTDEQLGRAIETTAARVDWPATPDLATSVIASIGAIEARSSLAPPRLSLPSRRRTLLLIAAALLALAGVALATKLVLDLGAVAIEVVPGPPTSLPTDVATSEDLGREVSPSRAAAIAGFDAALPAALGPPDRTWVDEVEIDFGGPTAPRIVSGWDPEPGLPAIEATDLGAVLMQFEGEWEVAAKQLHAETNRFGEAIVDGRSAFWTTGEHELRLITSDGAVRVLVTGNVLIWQDGGFTFRLETALGRGRAIRIAETVTPVDP